MVSGTEHYVAKELQHLKENAELLNWTISEIESTEFSIGFPGSNGVLYWCKVICDRYKTLPPKWHWYNKETKGLDQMIDIPKVERGGFTNLFHNAGIICAPWNRLAYKSEGHDGLHDDWVQTNWMTNPKTGGCKTLSAMANLIDQELKCKII